MRSVLNWTWSARRAIAFYTVLLLFGWIVGQKLMGIAIPEMRPMNEPVIHRMVMISLFVFVIAAAVPFVPGAEIGFALLLAFGGQAAPVVYAGMVGALLTSFLVAKFVPLSALARLAKWLHLGKISLFLSEMARLPRAERSTYASDTLSNGAGRFVVGNKYIALALLLNLPGNSVLGGGGGIGFMAGISGLYDSWAYLICVLLAVAPFPLFFWVFV